MLKEYLYLISYRTMTWIVRYLPQKYIHYLLQFFTFFAYFIARKHTKIIYTNLDFAYDHTLDKSTQKKIAKRVYYNLLQTIVSLMEREFITPKQLIENVTFQNDQILIKALKENKKIIFITGHYSNWELVPTAIATKYAMTLTTVGRKLDTPKMDQILVKNREKFGLEMLYREGAVRGTLKALREGKAVCMLPDQALGENQGGIKVTFFGKDVGHSPTASVLARSANAIIIPAFITTDDYKNYTLTFYDPIEPIVTENKEQDIFTMTQAQADITQKVIQAKPEEWFWFHRRWKVYYPELYKKVKE